MPEIFNLYAEINKHILFIYSFIIHLSIHLFIH